MGIIIGAIGDNYLVDFTKSEDHPSRCLSVVYGELRM